ncbi:hypothetical protein CLU84_1974 [Comamonas sp. 26]|nr:hypothetical protein CLU84_1974 [Comamonas sp. 26]
MFQDWFSSIYLNNCILNADGENGAEHLSQYVPNWNHYGRASYFCDQQISSINQCGKHIINHVDNIYVENFLKKPMIQSNPYKTIVMESNGKIEFSILEKYIKVEKEIYIYDQYINKQSKKLIDYIVNNAPKNCFIKVFLFEENNNCHSAIDLHHIYNSDHIKFYKVDAATAASIHDRFINFGRRIQVCFSVGLDQFNSKLINKIEHFSNRDSTITFYDINRSDSHYEISCDNGFEIKLKKRKIY